MGHDLETLLRVSPDAVVAVGSGGEILRVNAIAAEMFGHSAEALVGQPVEVLVPEALRRAHTEHRRRYSEAPVLREMGAECGMRALRADGTEFDADIKLAPQAELDDALIVAVVRDISPLADSTRRLAQRAEQLSETNHALEDFAHTAAHDLKGPLRAVSGYVDWLEEELAPHLDDGHRDLFERTRTGCDRMRELIDGALDFARATDNQQREVAPFDLPAEIRALVEELDPDGRFQVQVADLRAFETHAVPLRQVLANLLQNAFTHGGGPPLRVRVECEEDTDFFRFRVADDGCGVPLHAQRDVFRLFKSGGDGTGVGLSIVERNVRAHGGEVHLVSETGRGATFDFTWPVSTP